MKTKRFDRLLAFLLALVMLLPMISIPAFAESVGGIAYPTDADDTVFPLPIKAVDTAAHYLWGDKNNKGVFTDYTTTESNGTVTVTGTAKIGNVTY